MILWFFAWLMNGTPHVDWFNGWWWGFMGCWATEELIGWWHRAEHSDLEQRL